MLKILYSLNEFLWFEALIKPLKMFKIYKIQYIIRLIIKLSV